MDFMNIGLLAFFGAALVGLLVGWIVSSRAAFELGVGVGLLGPGIVGLTFATLCLLEYRAFSSPLPNKVQGTVIEFEDEPVTASGNITRPVAVIRFTAADQRSYTVRGPWTTGVDVGDPVTVMYDAADPARVRVADIKNLRGGAIAFTLFGTFPFSLGLWFIHGYAHERSGRWRRRGRMAGATQGHDMSVPPSSIGQRLTIGCNPLWLAGMLWGAYGASNVQQALMVIFGSATVALLGHGAHGLLAPYADARWGFGMVVLALNFFVVTVTLWVLSGPG
jgi:hypothetical protein